MVNTILLILAGLFICMLIIHKMLQRRAEKDFTELVKSATQVVQDFKKARHDAIHRL